MNKLILLLFVLAVSGFAQSAADAANPMSTWLRNAYTGNRNNIVRTAEKLPEDVAVDQVHVACLEGLPWRPSGVAAPTRPGHLLTTARRRDNRRTPESFRPCYGRRAGPMVARGSALGK